MFIFNILKWLCFLDVQKKILIHYPFSIQKERQSDSFSFFLTFVPFVSFSSEDLAAKTQKLL